jgi:hypothetical protein
VATTKLAFLGEIKEPPLLSEEDRWIVLERLMLDDEERLGRGG